MTLTEFLAELGMAKSRKPRGVAEASEVYASAPIDYLRELSGTVHDAARFPAVFDRLKSDKQIRREEIVEIASKFAFPMAKSTTKKAALDRIWRQHAASETTGAKNRSMAGKSAA